MARVVVLCAAIGLIGPAAASASDPGIVITQLAADDVTPDASTVVDASTGTVDRYSVSLSAAPSATVTLGIAPGDDTLSLASVDPRFIVLTPASSGTPGSYEVVFTPSSFNIPIHIVVSAISATVPCTHQVQVVHSALSGSAPEYIGTSATLQVENDTPCHAATSLDAKPLLVDIGPGLSLPLGRASATLTTKATGDPVGGKRIRFFVGSTPLCSALTDQAGVASCQASLGGILLGALGHGYTAYFRGDADYLPSSANAPAIRIGPVHHF